MGRTNDLGTVTMKWEIDMDDAFQRIFTEAGQT
ncbi:unnamed protein product, partial [marine sediment metagenome]